MTQEIELKLRISVDSIDALAAQLSLMAQEEAVKSLRNHYFDTPDLALAKSKAALRIRASAKGYEQTLKTRGHSQGGMKIRNEWNWPLASEALDLTLLTSDQVTASLPAGLSTDHLDRLFSTNFRRRSWHLEAEATRIEVVLDEGQVIAGANTQPLCELELEILDGDPHQLWTMLARLQKVAPMWLSDVSKAERGYGLAQDVPFKLWLEDDLPKDLSGVLSHSLVGLQRGVEELLWNHPHPACEGSLADSIWAPAYLLWLVGGSSLKSEVEAFLSSLLLSPKPDNIAAANHLIELSFAVYQFLIEPDELAILNIDWPEKRIQALELLSISLTMYDSFNERLGLLR